MKSRKVLPILIVAMLTGCAGPLEIVNTLGYFFVDGVTEAQTGKGVIDNAVSTVVGKDCKVKNVFKSKEKLCIEQKTNKNHGEVNGDKDNQRSNRSIKR